MEEKDKIISEMKNKGKEIEIKVLLRSSKERYKTIKRIKMRKEYTISKNVREMEHRGRRDNIHMIVVFREVK